MMQGVVNLRREATLTIVVGNSNRQLQAIDAVIDTGFNGFLSLPSTIKITSRYDVKLPEFNSRLARLQVERLDRSDVEKKYQRLKAFQAGSTVDRELQAQAKSIADGYPRLLEWLDKILPDDRTDSTAILAAMAGKQQEFLEDILAERLLAQQEPDLRLMLSRGLIFELPVPLAALQAICTDIRDLDRHVDRARSVGLLEVGLNGAVRVPRVLGVAGADNGAELAAIAVKILDREWIEKGQYVTEESVMEIHRLALLAGDGEIAVDMAMRLSNSWIANSRYREALTLCQTTLALQQDSKIIYNLSHIYDTLGDWEKSLELAQESLTINREIGDKQGEAASLHQIAMIYTNQGNWTESLQSCAASLTIKRAIGNQQGEAASLHQIAMIYTNQGNWTEALQSCTESLTILRAIGDKQGEAASLSLMGGLAGKQGDAAQREKFYLAAAQVYGEIGDYSGLVAMLRNLGFTVTDGALTYLAQALWLTRRLTTNLQSSIELIEVIFQRVPTGDPLEALLGATALYFCQDSPHPDRSQLQERSFGILSYAAQQQGITTQDRFDEWIVQNRLNDPNYYLPALDARLVELIGDNWLFDPRQVAEL